MGFLSWIRRQLRRRKIYRCRACGYEIPREEATVSGWDSESSLRHVHCPRCGKIMTHAPD